MTGCVDSANALGVGEGERLRDELAEDDREQRQEDGDHDEGDARRRRSAAGAERRRAVLASPSTRLTAANAEARKPMKVMPSWMTARNRPGSPCRRRTRLAPRLPSSTSCSSRLRRTVTRAISAADEDAVEEDEHDDDAELDGRRALIPAARRLAAGLGRGSRIRAGTPTASLPGGTSLVTTAPAPVLAPSPTVDRRDEHRVDAEERAVADRRVLLAGPVVVRGDRAGADVRPVADLGVAEVAHVVLLEPAPRRVFLSSA